MQPILLYTLSLNNLECNQSAFVNRDSRTLVIGGFARLRLPGVRYPVQTLSRIFKALTKLLSLLSAI